MMIKKHENKYYFFVFVSLLYYSSDMSQLLDQLAQLQEFDDSRTFVFCSTCGFSKDADGFHNCVECMEKVFQKINNKRVLEEEKSRQAFIEAWAETEKIKNEAIGRAQAQSELSRRAYLDSVKTEKTGKNGKKYLWVTVNPKQDVKLADFVKVIHKMYSKKWASKCAYIFEISDKFHSHGLIACEYEYARAKRELGNTVSGVCDINNSHIFKVVCIVDETIAMEKFRYMCGLKQKKKACHVKKSEVWRKENNLQSMYPKSGSQCLSTLFDSRKESSSDSVELIIPDDHI